jgi:hypothetical protein
MGGFRDINADPNREGFAFPRRSSRDSDPAKNPEDFRAEFASRLGDLGVTGDAIEKTAVQQTATFDRFSRRLEVGRMIEDINSQRPDGGDAARLLPPTPSDSGSDRLALTY